MLTLLTRGGRTEMWRCGPFALSQERGLGKTRPVVVSAGRGGWGVCPHLRNPGARGQAGKLDKGVLSDWELLNQGFLSRWNKK